MIRPSLTLCRQVTNALLPSEARLLERASDFVADTAAVRQVLFSAAVPLSFGCLFLLLCLVPVALLVSGSFFGTLKQNLFAQTLG